MNPAASRGCRSGCTTQMKKSTDPTNQSADSAAPRRAADVLPAGAGTDAAAERTAADAGVAPGVPAPGAPVDLGAEAVPGGAAPGEIAGRATLGEGGEADGS